MKSVLVDTSILIDFLRRTDKRITRLYKLSKIYQILAISVISHTELYAGESAWRNKELMQNLESLLSNLTVIPLTLEISKQAGKLRALNSLPTIDAIIAATALSEKLPLVTLNPKDFKRVKKLKLL